MEFKEELKYQIKQTFKWFADTFESGEFWFGTTLGLLLGGLFL